jgi:hypothetical protein
MDERIVAVVVALPQPAVAEVRVHGAESGSRVSAKGIDRESES